MPLNIAIIGAGIGGTALALELLKVPNVKSTIYELRADGYEQGQHISVAPNALRVLTHLGLLNKLKAIGCCYEDLDFRGANASKIASFANGSVAKYGLPAMRIHRRHVQELLAEECRENGIEIKHGMKLTKITEKGGSESVDLHFANGHDVSADLVVGADGLHSVVREYVAPNSPSQYAHMIGITGILTKDRLHPSAATIGLPSHFIGPNGFLAIMPSDALRNEIGFFSTMEFQEEKTRAEWDVMFHDKEKIRGILADHFNKEHGWCDLVCSMCEVVNESTLCSWPFYIAPKLPQWSSPSGRVLVMGDAAHAMIPTGGLGASLALEDAECLAIAIAHLAKSNAFSSSALTSTFGGPWEKHRKQRLALIQEFTDRNRKIRAPGGNFYAQSIKEWVLWMVLHFVGSDRVAGEIYGYDTKEFQQLLEG